MEVSSSYSQQNLESTNIPAKRIRNKSVEEEECYSKKRLMSADEFCFSFEDLNRQLYSKHSKSNESVDEHQNTPDELDFCFWCDAKRFQGDFKCPYHEHGAKISPKTTTSQDKPTKQPYAYQGIPEVLKLFERNTADEKVVGIQTAKSLPGGAWIGPYEGKLVKIEEGVPVKKNEYMWEIFKDGKLYGYIDGSDENTASWMRFIRCARHKEEQNLYAFQYMNKIYYRTYKTIEPGQELLVWYDQMYAQYMGIPCEGIYDMASSNGPSHLPQTIVQVTDDKTLTPPTTPTKSTGNPFTKHPINEAFPSNKAASLPGSRASPSSLQQIKRLEFPEERSKANQNETRKRAFPSQPIKIIHQQGSPNKCSPNSINCKVNGDTKAASTLPFNGFLTNTNENQARSFTDSNTSNRLPSPIIVKQDTEQEQLDDPTINQSRCGQCKQVFLQRSVLQTHVCEGVLLKPYQCGHCNKTFSNPGLMRLHAVTHQGKKPFKCGYCTRSFSGATTLNNHIRTHTGEKPFDCIKCGKSFTKGLQLSRHLNTPGDCVSCN